MLTTSPLALYIHLPWCVRKCPYCDFNSHTLRSDLPEAVYIQRLITDLEADLSETEKRPITTIFIGGGTPSLFSAASIEKLLMAIQQRCQFADNIEITLEANPGTVEKQRFAGYRAAGINRISLGIQSFQADKLKALGRIHDNHEAIKAAETAAQVGFTNFNLDLMHGLPQQTVEDALFDLTTAISLKPTHISWYQLTLEPNTLFAHQPPVLPADESIWDMQEQGRALLAQHHFQQYEISAYCQPNKHCRHNQNYWEFGDYLGIGAGAHSKITSSKNHSITRAWKQKNPKDYLDIAKPLIGEKKIISQDELPFEFMLNALRLYQPISLTIFRERTGLTLEAIQSMLHQAQQKELLIFDEHLIQPTELGRRFYNDLVSMFII